MMVPDAIWQQSPPALVRYVQAGTQALPMAYSIGGVGTGGIANETYCRAHYGYPLFVIESPTRFSSAPLPSRWAGLMSDIKNGFGRTMTKLPVVFGVSRQTLYNWLAGETPKEVHHARLRELAAAAQVFAEMGITPTANMLDRTVADGKSLLELLRDGAGGEQVARKLVRIETRSASSRLKLDAIVAGRNTRPTVSDMGTQAFDENL